MYLLTTINAMDIDLAKKSGSGGCGPRGGMHNNKTMYTYVRSYVVPLIASCSLHSVVVEGFFILTLSYNVSTLNCRLVFLPVQFLAGLLLDWQQTKLAESFL